MALHLSCREASRLISQGMDRRLSFVERIALRLHLGICDVCTRFTRQMEFIRRALKIYPGPDDPESR
ncbi:MAG TPA: zf-HC2 domain-containing protein [Burkholderiales bacterium]|nr:zf-HC2 domain-containing protein [Burkholderiales bacterium]